MHLIKKADIDLYCESFGAKEKNVLRKFNIEKDGDTYYTATKKEKDFFARRLAPTKREKKYKEKVDSGIATWKKGADGHWYIMIKGEKLPYGTEVKVSRRDRSTSMETVGDAAYTEGDEGDIIFYNVITGDIVFYNATPKEAVRRGAEMHMPVIKAENAARDEREEQRRAGLAERRAREREEREEQRKAEIAKERAREREERAKYSWLEISIYDEFWDLPDYLHGFQNDTRLGGLVEYKGRAYRVVSKKHVPEDDGSDSGSYKEEHYLVKATDMTEDAEGKAFLEGRIAARSKAKAEHYRIEAIKKHVEEKGEQIQKINGQEQSIPDGEVLLDTFNIHGSGEMIIATAENVLYIVNNHMDGDHWGRNTIAGGYGWTAQRDPVLEGLLGSDN